MASTRKTDETQCVFMLTLPRTVRAQIKRIVGDIETSHQRVIYPNKAINHIINKALGNPVNMEDPDIKILEEVIYGAATGSDDAAGGTDGASGPAAGAAKVLAGGAEETGSPRRRPRG